VTLSEFGFVDPLYAYYDSKLLLKRSPHVPLERLEKDMAEYRRLGIRMLGLFHQGCRARSTRSIRTGAACRKNTTEIPQVDMQEKAANRRRTLPAWPVR
jgi:hypothetical protein